MLSTLALGVLGLVAYWNLEVDPPAFLDRHLRQIAREPLLAAPADWRFVKDDRSPRSKVLFETPATVRRTWEAPGDAFQVRMQYLKHHGVKPSREAADLAWGITPSDQASRSAQVSLEQDPRDTYNDRTVVRLTGDFGLKDGASLLGWQRADPDALTTWPDAAFEPYLSPGEATVRLAQHFGQQGAAQIYVSLPRSDERRASGPPVSVRFEWSAPARTTLVTVEVTGP